MERYDNYLMEQIYAESAARNVPVEDIKGRYYVFSWNNGQDREFTNRSQAEAWYNIIHEEYGDGRLSVEIWDRDSTFYIQNYLYQDSHDDLDSDNTTVCLVIIYSATGATFKDAVSVIEGHRAYGTMDQLQHDELWVEDHPHNLTELIENRRD